MSQNGVSRKRSSTQAKIKDSYIRLLKTQKFDKITVRELCEDTEIVRSTFYTHYQSVYDLIEEIENDLLEVLVYYDPKLDEESLRRCSEKGFIPDSSVRSIPTASTRRFFERIDDDREYLKAILGENGDPYFEIRLKRQLEKDVNRMRDDENIPADLLRPYFSEAVVTLQLNLLKYWIRAEHRVTIEYICQLSNIVRAGSTSMKFIPIREDGPQL